jgi:hypothetical protein
MDVWEAIERAEPILPGRAAAEGRRDPRWQAIIASEEFVQEEPMPSGHSSCVGATADEDLRRAIATCLLEHWLEHHFRRFFPRVEEAVRTNSMLADTFLKCWKFGRAKEQDSAKRFDGLRAECRKLRSQT